MLGRPVSHMSPKPRGNPEDWRRLSWTTRTSQLTTSLGVAPSRIHSLSLTVPRAEDSPGAPPQLEDRPLHFVRKPGIWDPVVGLGWHRDVGPRLALHLTGEGGGFGVGADVDLAARVRVDLKLTTHFGLALGYSALYLELSDTVVERTFEIKQTMQGPTFGLGFYF